MKNNLPLVSTIIPCRNEEKFIGMCLDSIIANDYPKDRLEVLVVDGMSEDGTKKIIEIYEKQYQYINFLENPKKITPFAFNIGIKNSKGEVIMIMGAHTAYEKDYISKCIKYLREYDADNIGGIMLSLPRNDSLIGKAIAIALSNKFCVGSSRFRTGTKDVIEVDTVFGGCYKREVFDKIGLFNEELVSTQDMEFNLRLKKAGGKIILHPEIISYYYTRSDFKSYCKNNFRNGMWVILPFKYSTIIPISLRHLVPLGFVLSLIISGALSFIFLFFFWLFLLIVGLYLLTSIYFSTKVAIKEKNIAYLFLMPIIFASFHVIYGLGSIWALLKVILMKRFWRNLFIILKNR